jgi:glycosyltransferase involved in cell wall biosynthesis
VIVDVVIPALNEERSIGRVVSELTDPRIRRIVVVDNGSTDETARAAREAGAHVVREARRGYGRACLTGLACLSLDPPDTVLFVDGDYSDFPDDAALLLAEIEKGAELVIGSRVRGGAERGALMPVARFGNWLSTQLISALWAFTSPIWGRFARFAGSRLSSYRCATKTSAGRLRCRFGRPGWGCGVPR